MGSGSDTAPHEVDAALSGSFYYRDGLLATLPSLKSQYAERGGAATTEGAGGRMTNAEAAETEESPGTARRRRLVRPAPSDGSMPDETRGCRICAAREEIER
jgi:hypothetical protein